MESSTLADGTLELLISPEMKEMLQTSGSRSPMLPSNTVKLVPLSRKEPLVVEQQQEQETSDSVGVVRHDTTTQDETNSTIGDTDDDDDNEKSDNSSSRVETEIDDSQDDELVEVSAPRAIDDHFQDDDDDDDETISYIAPDTMPIVVVNVKRLLGKSQVSVMERDSIEEGMRETLFNRDGENVFDESISQLFEYRAARHEEEDAGISSSTTDDNPDEFSIQYPEFLIASNGRVLRVASMWKDLHRPHRIAIVQRLLKLLVKCSRSLLWKYDMREEVLALAKREEEQSIELKLWTWRTEGRKIQLDKLYQVRETFSQRLDVSRLKLEQLEQERDDKVHTQHGKGLLALDLESNNFVVNDKVKASELLGIVEEEQHYDAFDGEGLEEDDDDYDDVDNDIHEDDEEIDPVESNVMFTCIEGVSSARRKARKSRRKRAQRKRREQLLHAENRALEQHRIEQAQSQENELMEQFTTQELRMAYAVVRSLETRLSQVDDLLESLQDEEWKDEEEGYGEGGSKNESAFDRPSNEGETLLDQILAMILGTLYPSDGSDPTQAHYEFIRSEHLEVISSWRSYFGRLPPTPTSTLEWPNADSEEPIPTRLGASDRRADLGIIDNEDEDWETADDLDELVMDGDRKDKRQGGPVSATVAHPGAGLRPGGSTRR